MVCLNLISPPTTSIAFHHIQSAIICLIQTMLQQHHYFRRQVPPQSVFFFSKWIFTPFEIPVSFCMRRTAWTTRFSSPVASLGLEQVNSTLLSYFSL